MNRLFADAYYYLALLNPQDEAHARVRELARSLGTRTVTTAWVLTEVADAMREPAHRRAFLLLLDLLVQNPLVTIVPPAENLFDAGIALYRRRADKAWSLTDCISFVVMERHGLTEALTADRHFEQAGFEALLR